jgi:hypothetical protein
MNEAHPIRPALGARPGAWRELAWISILALAVRAIGLGATNLWLDEADSWKVANYPWGGLFGNLQETPAVPLFFILLKVWMGLFGDSEVALRSLSLGLSLALVPVTYQIGVRLLPARDALFGTLLLALSPLHLYFAQEARMYMLLALVTAGCALAYLAWFGVGAAPRGPGTLVLYVLLALLSLFTHYGAALLLAALNLDALIRFARSRGRKLLRDRRLWQWIGAQAAIAAPLALYLTGVDFQGAGASQGWRPAGTVEDALRGLFLFFMEAVHGLYYYAHDLPRAAVDLWSGPQPLLAWRFMELVITQGLTLLALVTILAFPPRAAESRQQAREAGGGSPAIFLYICLLLPLAIGVAAAAESGLHFARYFFFVTPFLYLLLGAGLGRLRASWRTAALVVLLASMVLGTVKHWGVHSRDTDYRSVAKLLERSVRPGDRVYLDPGEAGPAALYYLRDSTIRLTELAPGEWIGERLARDARDDDRRENPRARSQRDWILIDARSELYLASPGRLRRRLGAKPLLQRRFDSGGSAGVLVVALPGSPAS